MIINGCKNQKVQVDGRLHTERDPADITQTHWSIVALLKLGQQYSPPNEM